MMVARIWGGGIAKDTGFLWEMTTMFWNEIVVVVV